VLGVARRARRVAVVTIVRRGVVMAIVSRVVMIAMVPGVVWLCHHRAGKSEDESERQQRKQRSVFHDRHPSTQHDSATTMPHAMSRAAKINFFPQMNRK
jgi:hypothetical protein